LRKDLRDSFGVRRETGSGEREMSRISAEFIREIPKTDLHVHLDGSLRVGTLIELARERKIEIPSYSEAGLREIVFKERYESLKEYLRGFAYTCAVLQDTEALERAAYELAADAFSEGVRYIEPRMAPQLHINTDTNLPDVLEAVDRGLRRAASEWNADPRIKNGTEPPYAYGIIVCALRMFRPAFSAYYRNFINVHAYSPERNVFAAASLELARAAVHVRNEGQATIVGFDLAGQENGYPAHDHIEAYRYVHRNFFHKTVHAGEAYGPESIFEAITDLHTDRIGHGFHLFSTDRITNAGIGDPQRYVSDLAQYIADRRTTIEICLTSNVQTNPDLHGLAGHPAKKMLGQEISITFCTDNRLVSNTTITKELMLAVTEMGLTAKQLRDSTFNGFKRSFMPSTYLEKRDYVRRVIDYYREIEAKHGIE
jgi:adenosine deaminase